MAGRGHYRIQHVATTPRGWRVRSKREGGHVLRIAFPKGARKRGAGKVVEVLHPKNERNPCPVASKNPEELLIYGLGSLINPASKSYSALTKGGTATPAGHKPGCQCPFCKRARGQNVRRSNETPRQARKRRSASWTKALSEGRVVKISDGTLKSFPTVEAAKASGYPIIRNPKRRRRNQGDAGDLDQAVKLFQTFHGKDPKGVAELHESAAMRLDYAALGDLDYLKVETPAGDKAIFTFEGDGVKLAMSPDGKQLYCIGGNQSLVNCLDAASLQKDFIDLGDAIEVQYVARKIHDDFAPVQYYHQFGEENGELPRLMYDKLRRRIYFVGGDYFVNLSDKVSPGIEN